MNPIFLGGPVNFLYITLNFLKKYSKIEKTLNLSVKRFQLFNSQFSIFYYSKICIKSTNNIYFEVPSVSANKIKPQRLQTIALNYLQAKINKDNYHYNFLIYINLI